MILNKDSSLQLHEILNCNADDLENAGVFNAFINTDNPYFIHPNLLYFNDILEFKGAFESVSQQMVSVFDTLVTVGLPTALTKFNYPEPSYTYIGHGEGDHIPQGKGLTREKAKLTLENFHKLIKKNPTLKTRGDIFQVIPLFNRGIGCDLISDVIFYILRERFFKYTSRICKELKIENIKKSKDTFGCDVFFFEGKPVVFYPESLLTRIDNDEYIQSQISINEEVRGRFNEYLGKESFSQTAAKNFANTDDTVTENLESILDGLVKNKIDKETALQYIGEQVKQKAKLLSKQLPPYNKSLSLKENFMLACNEFKHKIEKEGLSNLLYDEGRIKHETTARDLFYLSLTWWNEKKVSIQRESSTGRGNMDLFIVSTTGSGETLVYELKLSSNQQTVHGYQSQLPIYMNAQRCSQGIFMLIQVSSSSCQYDKFQKKLNDPKFIQPNIECVFIDGRVFPSASKKKIAPRKYRD